MRTNQKKDREKILIMLHGWGGSAETFANLRQEVSAQLNNVKTKQPVNIDQLARYPVIQSISLDLPGFGSQTAPTSPWDTRDYAQWLDQKLKSLKVDPRTQDVHFYGHSFGCRVIIRWLLCYPDFNGKVILTGAAGIKWPPSLKQRVLRCIASGIRKCKVTSEKSKILTFIFHLLSFILPRERILRKLGAGDWAQADETLKPTLQKVLEEEDLRDYLPQIKNKTLLIWGRHDTYTPLRSAHVFAEKLPHCKLIIFEDGRHAVHHTHTQKIAALVSEFLNP